MRRSSRMTTLLPQLIVALVLLGAAMAMSTCSDVVEALNPLAFHPDSCAEFSFWRNDTLLVKNLKVEIARDNVNSESGCRFQNWNLDEDDSWMWYGLSGPGTTCDDFDAEIHTGKRYWEVTKGTVVGSAFTFAEGEWKLHEVNGSIDKIIDGGTFEFEFHDTGTCP